MEKGHIQSCQALALEINYMKTKILFIVAVIMIGFLVSSCSKKTLIDIKNTSDQQYEIRFDGQVFSLGRNSVVELMHLAEEFTLLDPQGRNYSYTWKSLPPPPSEYIDRRFFNNRIRC